MHQTLSELIFKDLANNISNISDYDFFRLKDFIINKKNDFTFDLLLIAFTNCYNNYIENLAFLEKDLDKKSLLETLSLRCKELLNLINIFDEDILLNFIGELKEIILSLFSNNDINFVNSFFYKFSKIEPLFCLKLLKKKKDILTENLNSLLLILEDEYEQYQTLSFEIEEILNRNISDFKYDFPAFNYLDFL
ncbi:MAG: hypothetical protein ACK4YF_09655 [Exilispira sp.]